MRSFLCFRGAEMPAQKCVAETFETMRLVGLVFREGGASGLW